MIWFNAESILLALKQDPEVAHLAAVYLKWAVLGLPAYSFNTISRRYFQSQGLYNDFFLCVTTLTLHAGLFAAPTRVIICVAPINAVLNYILGVS